MNAFARWFAALAGRGRPPLRPHALPAGAVLGGVMVGAPIGRGSSAVVYAATDVASGEARALKVWCPAAGLPAPDAAAARERFLAEGQRMQALRHPGIVRVHDSGQARGLAWIVAERIADGSLAAFTGGSVRLPPADVLDIAAQLADALAHAHRHGVLHRDVKPANVLFDRATRRAALADFGLARAADGPASRSGQLLGSPVYMAPELLAGQPPSAASDLYALGVLTWQLLAGRPPFEAASMGALMRAVAQSPPPLIGPAVPGLNAAAAARLDALFARWLAKEAAPRPADGTALAAALRDIARVLPPPQESAANATKAD